MSFIAFLVFAYMPLALLVALLIAHLIESAVRGIVRLFRGGAA